MGHESENVGSPPRSQVQPLDLRLLPAALTAWAAALVAIFSAEGLALGLGAVLTTVAGLSAVALILLPRASSAPRWGAALQTVLCLAVGGSVMLSAGFTDHRLESAGWSEVTESQAPAEVTLRISADPRSLASRDAVTGESGGVRAPAVVSTAQLPGQQKLRGIGAQVLVIARGADADDFIAGQRYQMRAEVVETDRGDQATALVMPFGDARAHRVEPDRWSTVTHLFNSIRSSVADSSEAAVGDGAALLPGVVLGDRSRQGEELTEAMRVSGLSHMSVVSGTHTSLVMGALLGLLRLGRAPRWSLPPALIVGLVLYVLLVQPAPSVIRAAVMGSIGALAVFAGRGRASSALLCGCVIILLLYDPGYASTAAFQLSVAATAGIVAVGHRLKLFFSRGMPTLLAGPLALAVSAQLFITPVLLPIAEGITLYSIPANIIAGPLLPFATVPGTAAAVLITVVPPVGTGLLWLAGFPAAGIGATARTASELPQALAPWPAGWQGWAMAGIYVAAAIVLSWSIVQARRPRRVELSILGGAAGMLIAVVLPVAAVFSAGPPENWRVAMCDVGQGDMLVVRTATQEAIVVDAGEEPELAQQCLQGLDVETVSVLMLTHEHFDHYGGAPGVAAAAQVEQIIHAGSAGWSPSEAFTELGGQQPEAPARRGQVGERHSVGAEYPVSWSVWAASDYHPNPNNNSLVTLFEIEHAEGPADADGPSNNPLRLLALGDLEEEVSSILLHAELLPDDIDVLKVAHHGAANGGTETITALQPQSALISVGEDNTYGHPDAEILSSLEELRISAVYRTDIHGTVVVFSLSADGFQAERLN